MKYSEEEIAWAKSLIQPELPELDEKDHQIARLRFILNHSSDALYDILYDIKHKRITDVKEVQNRLDKFLFDEDGNCNFPDGESLKDIENYAENYNWSQFREVLEKGYHVGDCTAVAAPCSRCFVEQFYENVNTPFEGKSNGWKALHIFRKTDKGE